MVLCGSPRSGGSTDVIVQWAAEGARQAGATVEIIDVTKLTYKSYGCTACMGCQRSKKFACVIPDEATPVLARIPENDILVFATPLYFFGPSAQLKVFTDRMYSLFKFDRASGIIRHNLGHMKCAVISTAGSNEFGSLTRLFDVFASFLGAQVQSLLIPFVRDTDTLRSSAAVRQKAIVFGAKLVQT